MVRLVDGDDEASDDDRHGSESEAGAVDGVRGGHEVAPGGVGFPDESCGIEQVGLPGFA